MVNVFIYAKPCNLQNLYVDTLSFIIQLVEYLGKNITQKVKQKGFQHAWHLAYINQISLEYDIILRDKMKEKSTA